MTIVSLNSRIALLANAVAGRHLTIHDETGETAKQQAKLLEISGPHIHAMSSTERSSLTAEKRDELCVAAVDSRGLVNHSCQEFDTKTLPCLNCPHVLAAMPDITGGFTHEEPHQPPIWNKPNLPIAAFAALKVLETIRDWADGLLRESTAPSRHLTAAAIAAGETAYYIAAAIETHPRHGRINARNDEDPHYLKSLEIYDRLYLVMGAPDKGTISPTDYDSPFCTRMCFAPTPRLEYWCEPENGQIPAGTPENGMRDQPCSNCPCRTGQRRPLPSELLHSPR